MFSRVALSFLMLVALAGIAPAAPSKWQVDAAKSSLTFEVTVNGQKVTGKWKAFGALITFDPADLVHSSAKITMDMTEVKSGDATRDAMLLKPEWFNVLDFPQSVFQTTSFVSKGGDAYEARGQLKLKSVTKDVVLPFILKIAGDTAVMNGQTTLLRTAFTVGQSAAFATDTPVALNVKVLVNVTAKRAK